MNILLVNPTQLDERGIPIKYKEAFFPPLSLAIFSSLTPKHHTVTVIDDSVEEIDFSIPYDLVGITAMTPQSERAYQIAEIFLTQGVKVVIGGMHATVLPEEVKQYADAVVIGEVEPLWEQILDDCEMGLLDEFYQAPTFPDLQNLVIPQWENINLSLYTKHPGARLPRMPIFTTRGCPYGCKFCSVTHHYGKSYRFKPIAHVLQEIEATGAEDYFFVDDNIACDPDYSRELFQALIPKKVRWMSQASTTILKSPDLIDLAAKAGCTMLVIGIESLSQESLQSVNKGFNKVGQYEELIARLHKAGILPYLSFIFGFDDDSGDPLEQFENTVACCRRNHIMLTVFWLLTPFPGTTLFEEMEAAGRIEHHKWSLFDAAHLVFQPKHMSKEQMYEAYWKPLNRFILLSTVNK